MDTNTLIKQAQESFNNLPSLWKLDQDFDFNDDNDYFQLMYIDQLLSIKSKIDEELEEEELKDALTWLKINIADRLVNPVDECLGFKNNLGSLNRNKELAELILDIYKDKSHYNMNNIIIVKTNDGYITNQDINNEYCFPFEHYFEEMNYTIHTNLDKEKPYLLMGENMTKSYASIESLASDSDIFEEVIRLANFDEEVLKNWAKKVIKENNH